MFRLILLIYVPCPTIIYLCCVSPFYLNISKCIYSSTSFSTQSGHCPYSHSFHNLQYTLWCFNCLWAYNLSIASSLIVIIFKHHPIDILKAILNHNFIYLSIINFHPTTKTYIWTQHEIPYINILMIYVHVLCSCIFLKFISCFFRVSVVPFSTIITYVTIYFFSVFFHLQQSFETKLSHEHFICNLYCILRHTLSQ